MYLQDWSESKAEGMARDFEIDVHALDSLNVLLATYTYENYSGEAFVLFEKDGALFEVVGGHCSCFGLEGQWEPEETTVEALMACAWYPGDDGDGMKSLIKQVTSSV